MNFISRHGFSLPPKLSLLLQQNRVPLYSVMNGNLPGDCLAYLQRRATTLNCNKPNNILLPGQAPVPVPGLVSVVQSS